MTQSNITQEAVLHVAKLARLALTPEEVSQYTQDLGNIVHLFDQLNQLNLSEIDESAASSPLPPLLREDVAIAWPDHKAVMQGAPVEEDGFYQVPKILES
jgi:aspartyl-tRNA(Asn)/glutamyl-tRNA(Gln) amidotransferase subunit C